MAALLPPGVSFEQTDEDLEVRVELGGDSPAVRADLAVRTTANTLQVWRKHGAEWRPLLVGTLRHAVEASSCCWSLEKGAVVVQLEKAAEGAWDVLLKADAGGSILSELGRDQVIADADSDASSVTCGRCGQLVARSRWDAHETLWCPALGDDDEGAADEHEGGGGDSAAARAAAAGVSPQPAEPSAAPAPDGQLV